MKKLVVAFALTALVAAPAFAAETDFTKIDTDADGSISFEEAKAGGWGWDDDKFEQADTDGDGKMSQEEFRIATGQ